MRVNLGYWAPEPGSCGSNRDFWSAHGTGAALLCPECPIARVPRPLRPSRPPCPPGLGPPRPDPAAPPPDSGLGGGGHALSDRSPGTRCPRPTAPRPRAHTSTGREDGAGRETQQCTGRLSRSRWKAFLRSVAVAEKSWAWNASNASNRDLDRKGAEANRSFHCLLLSEA